MSVAVGTRLGIYEIVSVLGAGGMGEVYRARDTKLGRDVAIKVLPASLTSDPERLARFSREAQVLAALNHPNIAAIYHVEETGDGPAIVMELVEGETLADRIARGPIPVDEALPIAKQIAEALEAAHEQGIIHRDLKPANIKVRPDGSVKVLDFGLAKLGEAVVGGPQSVAGLSLSPTITSPAMTGIGVLLGTAAYMSPEQAKGMPADKRSDIWAFGCLLFEMLAGKRAFEGDDVADTLAAVLRGEPDWSAIPQSVSPALTALIRGCLIRNRRHRIGDISAARFVLGEYGELTPVVRTVAPVVVRRPLLGRAIAPVFALTVGGLLLAVGLWAVRRPAALHTSRLTIATAGVSALSINGGNDRDIAIAPDASRIVYVGNNATQLFVRALDSLEPTAIFKGVPRSPAISPDGQWVAFVDGNTNLKKVAITGGPAFTLWQLDASSRGVTWATDDSIVVATANAADGLLRVPASGGPPVVLTHVDRTHGEADHVWPSVLPGGRAVLFTMVGLGQALNSAQIAVLDLQTAARKVLVRGGSDGRYVSGYLVYAAEGTLRAVAFDPVHLEVHGTPVPVVPHIVTTALGAADMAAGADGTFVYLAGGPVTAIAEGGRTLAWVDRRGHETAIPAPPRAYVYPRISPDNSRLALGVFDQDVDIWSWDMRRMTFTRMTFDPALDSHHEWTPDGRRLVFSSERDGTRNIFSEAADGTGRVERLTQSPDAQTVTGMVPDGTAVIFAENVPATNTDVMQLSLGDGHRVTPLVRTSFTERNGVISPDGRWLAYEADDSGEMEVYVRPYPNVNDGHWQVSTGGGTRPLWARSGQELFYISRAGAVMRVGVERSGTWSSTTPTVLIKEGYLTMPTGNPGRAYDVSADGQRFLMIKAGNTANTTAPQLIVIQNWAEELKRLVPVN